VGAFTHIAKLQRANRDADEAKNFRAQGIEHAPDLSVLAFVECNFDPGALFTRAEDAGTLGLEKFTVRHFDAPLQCFHQSGIGDHAELDVIGLVEMRSGIGDASGPLRIIREEQQALAGLVEAADGGNPGKIQREKRINGVATLFIGGGSDDASRFVENEIDFFHRSERFSFYLNAISAESDGRFGIADSGAVEADFAIADQVESLRAGTITEFR